MRPAVHVRLREGTRELPLPDADGYLSPQHVPTELALGTPPTLARKTTPPSTGGPGVVGPTGSGIRYGDGHPSRPGRRLRLRAGNALQQRGAPRTSSPGELALSSPAVPPPGVDPRGGAADRRVRRQVVALAIGSLLVVQAIVVSSFVIALPCGVWLTDQRLGRREVLGALTTVATSEAITDRRNTDDHQVVGEFLESVSSAYHGSSP